MSDAQSFPYNYPNFVRGLESWIFDADREIPRLGEKAPDFPLWYLDGRETRLSEIWQQYNFTIVEFGSFT